MKLSELIIQYRQEHNLSQRQSKSPENADISTLSGLGAGGRTRTGTPCGT